MRVSVLAVAASARELSNGAMPGARAPCAGVCTRLYTCLYARPYTCKRHAVAGDAMAYVVMAHIVYGPYSYGPYSYGL